MTIPHPDIVLSQTDGRPMYLQIAEQIKQRVAIGDWQPGQSIPSIRGLAVALRVSVITTKRAYLELEREGVIVTRHGKGSFIADGVDLASELRRRELDAHLRGAVRQARLMGQGPDELAERLRELFREMTQEPP